MRSCVDRKKYISFSKKMTLFTRGRDLSYLILVDRLQLKIFFIVSKTASLREVRVKAEDLALKMPEPVQL